MAANVRGSPAPGGSGTAPGISVVIPCYNAASYLAEAIGSVLSQETRPIEIIVVDDGSTDGSDELARSFPTELKLIRQTNAGASVARNAGIVASRGAYIALLDADDLWPAASLAMRLALLHANPLAGFAYGAVEHFFSPDLADSRRAAIELAPVRPARLAGAMLFRRAALDAVGLFDPGLRMGEMLDWSARAERIGIGGTATTEIVLRRRIHGTNSVHARDDYQANNLRALRAVVGSRRSANNR